MVAERRARGTVAVEMALVLGLFFWLVFAMLELFRAVYVWNSTVEVTRRAARAASVSDFSDAAAMEALRRAAVMDAAGGALPLGGAIRAAEVRIDYLSLASGALRPQAMAALPASPQQNAINCGADPNGANCIRFVRARLCAQDDSAGCSGIAYRPMLAAVADSLFVREGQPAVSLPLASAVVRAESLGYHAGRP